MRSFLPVIIALLSVSLLNAEPQKYFYSGHWLISGFKAQEKIQNCKATQKDFGDFCEVVGYIAGVVMMGQGRLWLCPANSTRQQFIAIVVKYMNSHPEQWGDHSCVIISRAMAEAFPVNNAGNNNSINIK
jgi:hypothetical protein